MFKRKLLKTYSLKKWLTKKKKSIFGVWWNKIYLNQPTNKRVLLREIEICSSISGILLLVVVRDFLLTTSIKVRLINHVFFPKLRTNYKHKTVILYTNLIRYTIHVHFTNLVLPVRFIFAYILSYFISALISSPPPSLSLSSVML